MHCVPFCWKLPQDQHLPLSLHYMYWTVYFRNSLHFMWCMVYFRNSFHGMCSSVYFRNSFHGMCCSIYFRNSLCCMCCIVYFRNSLYCMCCIVYFSNSLHYMFWTVYFRNLLQRYILVSWDSSSAATSCTWQRGMKMESHLTFPAMLMHCGGEWYVEIIIYCSCRKLTKC